MQQNYFKNFHHISHGRRIIGRCNYDCTIRYVYGYNLVLLYDLNFMNPGRFHIDNAINTFAQRSHNCIEIVSDHDDCVTLPGKVAVN